MDTFLERLAPIWTPHPGQQRFLRNRSSIKVLACGRRWGKTDVAAVEALGALQRPKPTRHILLAPTQDQANLLFDRLAELLAAWVERYGHDPPTLKRTPHPELAWGRHRVLARSGHVGRSLRGHGATHLVVDEAAFVAPDLITEVAMPMLATTKGQMTLISTPKGRNLFWKFFQHGQRGEHGVWSRRAPSGESPWVSPEFLAVQRELISDRAYRVEYDAEFLDAEGQVFRTEAVEACLTAERFEPTDEPVALGIDWGRYTDHTAVAVLQGDRSLARLLEVHHWTGIPWASQLERVQEIAARYPGCSILCDGTGVGDPMVEALRTQCGVRSEAFVFTPSGKAELVDTLAWLIERHALRLPPDPALLRELEHFEACPADTGHVRYGAQSGYHDDLVIALALAARQLRHPYSAGISLGSRRTLEP